MKNLTNYKTALLVSFFIVTARLISFGQITVVEGGTYTTNSSTLVIDRPEDLSINDVMIVEIIQHNNDIPIVLDEALIAEGWNPIAHSFLNTTTKACTSLLYRIATSDDLEADSYTFTLFYDTKFAAGGITAYTGVGINQGYTETGDAGGPFDAVPQTDFTKGLAFRLNTYVIPISAESIETNTSSAAVSFFLQLLLMGWCPGCVWSFMSRIETLILRRYTGVDGNFQTSAIFLMVIIMIITLDLGQVTGYSPRPG